jgi:hypothetical protein
MDRQWVPRGIVLDHSTLTPQGFDIAELLRHLPM